MADTHKSKAGGLTQGKAILIALLAVVLLTVLYLQFGRSNSTSGAPANAGRRRPVVASSSAAKPAADKKDSPAATQAVVIVDPTRWKSPDPIQVVKYDPFALPDAFPRPALAEMTEAAGKGSASAAAAAAEENERKLAAIQNQWLEWEDLKRSPVHVIMKGSDQYVAMVGDRTIHVGDEISGYTVTGIDSSGVHVVRKADP